MGEGLNLMSDVIDTPPTGPAAPLPPPPPTAPAPLRGAPRRTKRSPAGVRVLWKVFAGILIVGALVWGPYSIVTLLAHEERVETESFPAAGIARLHVGSSSGSIEITAVDIATVDVRAEISDGLRRTGESRDLIDDELRLRSTCPNFGSDFCWVDYQIRVPRDLELVVDSDNGSITVTGSAASITADSDNGSLRVNDVSGPLQLSSDNGRVEATQLRSRHVTAGTDTGRVELEFDAAPTTVLATSSNGRVEVVVPNDGTAYRVEVHSDNGSETIDVPTDPAGDRSITVRTDNGSATARTS
jgi:hypothetical protein